MNRYGGDPGIRDMELLKSAIGAPAATFDGEFLHQDLCEMAAAYLFHIVMDHPFVDGNKRTGAVCAIIFLSLNDYELKTTQKDLVEVVHSIIRGEMPKSVLSEFIRHHLSPK